MAGGGWAHLAPALAAVLAGVATLLLLPGPPAARWTTSPRAAGAGAGRLARPTRPPAHRGAAAAAGLAAAVLVGWPGGVVAGLVVGVGAYVALGRFEPAAIQARRRREQADLPVACDLLVGCLAAGAGVDGAARAAGTALGGPLGERLCEVADRLALGASADEAWAAFARVGGGGTAAHAHQRVLGDLARAVAVACESGAPLATVLAGLADDARARATLEARLRAKAVGVRAVLPLGLCFLPAFVLLGVVPVVAGMASRVFG